MFNFCVFECSSKKSYMYMYDEVTGKKGPNEVISFINHYFDNIMRQDVATLYLFSDNCGAQNKNNILVQYLFVKAKQKNINIFHHLPEPGHSFLPCDRSFGVIEKQKRVVERIYVPNDWRNLVGKCSTKFHVVKVDNTMILDFKSSLAPFFKPPTNCNKIKWTISKYRRFEYVNDKHVVKLSASITHCGPLTNFDIVKKTNMQSDPLAANRMYEGDLPINAKKYEDVMVLARKYVPTSDMEFYNSLLKPGSAERMTDSEYETD